MSDLSDGCCTCFQSAPCVFCMAHSSCESCGKIHFDYEREDSGDSIGVCEDCQEKYRIQLEGHKLDCTCEPCMAFVNAEDAETGFRAAIPLMIAAEAKPSPGKAAK